MSAIFEILNCLVSQLSIRAAGFQTQFFMNFSNQTKKWSKSERGLTTRCNKYANNTIWCV